MTIFKLIIINLSLIFAVKNPLFTKNGLYNIKSTAWTRTSINYAVTWINNLNDTRHRRYAWTKYRNYSKVITISSKNRDVSSTLLPVADLREAKGELNRRSCLQDETSPTGIHNLPLVDSYSPPEVQSTSPSLAESSSNYLSLKSNATPGDRGEESETINGSRGEVNREAATASGMEGGDKYWTSSGLSAADLREAKGEVNKGSRLQDENKVVTSSGTSSIEGADIISSMDMDNSLDDSIESFRRSFPGITNIFPSSSQITSGVLLDVRSVDISLGDRILFDNVSFKLNVGECVGMIGNNGAGKTTLLDVIYNHLSGTTLSNPLISYSIDLSYNVKDIDNSFISNSSLYRKLYKYMSMYDYIGPNIHDFIEERSLYERSLSDVGGRSERSEEGGSELSLGDGRYSVSSGSGHNIDTSSRLSSTSKDLQSFSHLPSSFHSELPSSLRSLELPPSENFPRSSKNFLPSLRSEKFPFSSLRSELPSLRSSDVPPSSELSSSLRSGDRPPTSDILPSSLRSSGPPSPIGIGYMRQDYMNDMPGDYTVNELINNTFEYYIMCNNVMRYIEDNIYILNKYDKKIYKDILKLYNNENKIINKKYNDIKLLIKRLIILFSIEDKLNKKINTLSDGYKMRIYLLLLLLHSPNLLLLDEPTNNLDIDTKNFFINILKYLMSSNNLTILLISHDINILNNLCNNILQLIGNGNIQLFNGNFNNFLKNISIQKLINNTKINKLKKKY